LSFYVDTNFVAKGNDKDQAKTDSSTNTYSTEKLLPLG